MRPNGPIVFFDAFATLIKPRLPITEQYAEVFRPHFTIDQNLLGSSFKSALKQVQKDKPSYTHNKGAFGWWSDVIRAAAIGAGGEISAVDKSLPIIVPILMKRFSSKEGYVLYPDVLSTLSELKAKGALLGVISNSDSRVRAVLQDLSVLSLVDVCILSEEEGVEKPNPEIWRRGLKALSPDLDLSPRKPDDKTAMVMHVGDEILCDYMGAKNSGLYALLVRRPGEMGAEERREVDEDLSVVEREGGVVSSLNEVVHRVDSR